jgi:hypothetical protein
MIRVTAIMWRYVEKRRSSPRSLPSPHWASGDDQAAQIPSGCVLQSRVRNREEAAKDELDEVEAGVRTATDDNASDGVTPLLFALFCFVIAGFAFFAAFIAAHSWLAVAILLRLSEGSYIRAALWSCVLAFLVSFW